MDGVFVYYVYQRAICGNLIRIYHTCGSLQGARTTIEQANQVDRYEEEAEMIFAVVAGERAYRIEPRRLG
jgi:hypothetical protein